VAEEHRHLWINQAIVMRVLCLNYEYPPIGGGGGRSCAKICEALVKRGMEVRVLTSGMPHLPVREVLRGVEIVRHRSFRQREDTCSVPEMALYLVAGFFPAWGEIRRWKPDVIHVHFAVPTGALGWFLHRVTGVPYVLTAHLGDVPGGVPEQTDRLFRVVGPFTRPIWKDAAAITAVSGFVARLAAVAYGRNPTVIPNGIDLDPRPQLASAAVPRILMVGRLSVQKNPLLAIRALAKIKDLPWSCEIVGDGPLRPEIEREILAHDLGERILLRGWMDSAGVHERMRGAEILLMPSLSEGMPVAAVEALNHGVAIVCGVIDGMADVVDSGENGLRLPLEVESFAAGLRSLIVDPELRLQMRKNASAKAVNFDIARTSAEYEAVLQSALKR
jgi:glycosyltransferase involved in cell wall biosynthesis